MKNKTVGFLAITLVICMISSESVFANTTESDDLTQEINNFTREMFFLPACLPVPVMMPFAAVPWKLFTWKSKVTDYPLESNLYRKRQRKTACEVLIGVPVVAVESVVIGIAVGIPLGVWQMIRWGKPGYFARTILITNNRAYEFFTRYLNQAGY
ncbi:hypothetical protein KAI19_03345 [bacterium]|nr:hypothetical protein [bacterium]